MIKRLLPALLIIAGILTASIPVIGNIYTYFQQRSLLKQLEEALDQPYLADNIYGVEDIGEADGFGSDPEGPGTAAPGDNVEADEQIDGNRPQNGISDEDIKSESPLPGKQNSAKPTEPPKTSARDASKTEVKAIAALEIKSIGLKVPVVEGVKPENLRVGVGHLTGTTPIGEIGNAVLAGHRNYTFARYFRHLDKLENGDTIKITTKQGTFTYVVYKKLIVEPDDLSVLKKNNKDRVLTLITCHPVPVSTHRLVIHARLLENN